MSTTTATRARVARWLRRADEAERRAGAVLASALAADEQNLVEAVSATWGDDAESAVVALRHLLARPFVEQFSDGYGISAEFRSELLTEYRARYGEQLQIASAYFLEREKERLKDLDEDIAWLTRGRIGFYLAAVDSEASVDEFLRAFRSTRQDADDARSWLAEIALMQAPLLVDQSRALTFFRAFRAYQDGRTETASEGFREVVEGSQQEDDFLAISLHLWAVCNTSEGDVREQLGRAVELSAHLGLIKNEVMARNTLVFAHISQADPKDLAIAASLSRMNAEAAARTGDDFLRSWTMTAQVTAEWLAETDVINRAKDAAPDLVERLLSIARAAAELSLERGDDEGYVAAMNAAAGIYRDTDAPYEVVAIATTLLSEFGQRSAPQNGRRIAQTVGSLRRQKLSEEERDRVEHTLNSLNAWLSGYAL